MNIQLTEAAKQRVRDGRSKYRISLWGISSMHLIRCLKLSGHSISSVAELRHATRIVARRTRGYLDLLRRCHLARQATIDWAPYVSAEKL